ncbi:MAG: D,D-dipeptide ABC transporter permease, partial [Candidatus Limnocylindrales bacterium]
MDSQVDLRRIRFARLTWFVRLEPAVVVGGLLVAVVVALAVLAPLISPHDPLAQV